MGPEAAEWNTGPLGPAEGGTRPSEGGPFTFPPPPWTPHVPSSSTLDPSCSILLHPGPVMFHPPPPWTPHVPSSSTLGLSRSPLHPGPLTFHPPPPWASHVPSSSTLGLSRAILLHPGPLKFHPPPPWTPSCSRSPCRLFSGRGQDELQTALHPVMFRLTHLAGAVIRHWVSFRYSSRSRAASR